MSEVKDGGVYTLTATISETTNYIAQSLDVTLKVKAATVGSVNYTVEDAVAQGTTATLFGNAFIANDLTIPSGTTLILPSDQDGSNTFDPAASYINGANETVINNDGYVKYTLTIFKDATVNISGNILIKVLWEQRHNIVRGTPPDNIAV